MFNTAKKMTSRRLYHKTALTMLTLPFIFSLPAKANAESLDSMLADLAKPVKASQFLPAQTTDKMQASGNKDLFKAQWITDKDARFSSYYRVDVQQAGQNTWDVTVKSGANTQAVKKGDWLYASFYVRSTDKNNRINVKGFIERGQPWMRIADASVTADQQWTRVVALGRAQVNLAAGSSFVSLHLAQQQQTLDIANIEFAKVPGQVPESVFPSTELTYQGMQPDAKWRKQAQQMIDKHRKDDFVIELVNKQGKAVKHLDIELKQQSLDYQIGSFVSSNLYTEQSAQGDQYRAWFNEFFNYATTAIYWADWGWADPDIKQTFIKTAETFNQANIPMRAHVLLYPGFKFSPQSLIDLKDDKQKFIAKVDKHIEEMVAFLKEQGINEYDVINELRDETEWTDVVGLDQVVTWYKKVHKLHPEATLYLNENSILTDGGDNQIQQDHYFNLIETLLAKGAPIHGIGMQGHFNGVVTPVDKLWKTLDRFSQFGLPIRITEYDTDTRDEQGQASYDTDFYTAMLAHPATVGVTRWGYFEPEMWRPKGALIDSDKAYKANGVELKNWLDQYTLDTVNLTSDKQGKVTFNHLSGQYQVSLKPKSSAHTQTYTCHFSAEKKAQSAKVCRIQLD